MNELYAWLGCEFLWWHASNICESNTQDNKMTSFTRWRQNRLLSFTRRQSRILKIPKSNKSCSYPSPSHSLPRRPLTCPLWQPSRAGSEVLGEPLMPSGIRQVISSPCRLAAWKFFCQPPWISSDDLAGAGNTLPTGDVAWLQPSAALQNSSRNACPQWGGPLHLQVPHPQIQPNLNWKYIFFKFQKFPKSKTWVCHILATIYIVFTLY